MTVVTNYPREIVYVMSCKEVNTGHLLFFGLDDFSKLIFTLGMFENFSDETYEKVIYALYSCDGDHISKPLVVFFQSCHLIQKQRRR